MPSLLDEAVRILARRQHRDVHLEPFCDQQLARSGRGTLTGGVGIEAQDHLRREAPQELRLRRRSARYRGRDDRRHARLHELSEVEIALDHARHNRGARCPSSSGATRTAFGPSCRWTSRASSGTSAADPFPSRARRTRRSSRRRGKSESSGGRGSDRLSGRCRARRRARSGRATGARNPSFDQRRLQSFIGGRRIPETKFLDRLGRDAAVVQHPLRLSTAGPASCAVK